MTDRELHALVAVKAEPVCPDCSDHDDDCAEVPDKVHCYLYDPARGMCPYLRATMAQTKETP